MMIERKQIHFLKVLNIWTHWFRRLRIDLTPQTCCKIELQQVSIHLV